MIDPRKLRLLSELELRATMTAVAEALSFTPSAVSQQLSKLEEEVGAELFERTGRTVRLTDAGRRLALHARSILAAIDAAESDLAAHSATIAGRVRVATFQSAGIALLAPAIKLLAGTHPEIEVDVVLAEPETAIPSLLLGDLHLVFVDDYGPAARPPPSLDQQLLLEEPLRLVLPSVDPLLRRSTVRMADLADRAWASGQPGSAYSEAVERICRELGGFAPRIHHRSSDLILLLRLVEAGHAVALLPDLLAAEASEHVAVCHPREGRPTRRISTLVRSSSAARPTLVALRSALRAKATERRGVSATAA